MSGLVLLLDPPEVLAGLAVLVEAGEQFHQLLDDLVLDGQRVVSQGLLPGLVHGGSSHLEEADGLGHRTHGQCVE